VPARGTGPVRILECDVWDAHQLIGTIGALPTPDAIFSNSDRLQTQTALAAAYFGLPGKDWRSALRAKNKPLMRRRLAETGIEHVAAAEIRPGTGRLPGGLAYPVVLKPAEGVASEDVILVRSPEEFQEQESLPPGPPPEPARGRAHAVIDYVVADRSGLLAAAPPASSQRSAELGVTLCYRPLRAVGDRITLTHTNRDYLGVITAIGPEAAAVELSVAGLRTAGSWEITESQP
jgi:hypothetical protein